MRSRRQVMVLAGAGLLLFGLCAVAGPRFARLAHIRHPKTGAALLVPGQDGDATILHNGWRIRPAGRPIATGDMLLGGAVSPDGTIFAIVNAGFSPHALHLIDLATERETATLPLAHAWNGIAWAPDGRRLYVGGGVTEDVDHVYVFDRSGGDWKRVKGLKLAVGDPKKTCVAGLALSADGRTLYALNTGDGCLYTLNAETGDGIARAEVGDHPVVCRRSGDGKRLYVADWGGSEVVAVDTTDPAHPVVTAHIPTGEHPNDIALSRDDRLFVSCGNADAVTVYDLKARAALETVRTALTPLAPSGSTPDALAISPDNRTLYVANADNNDVCVVDISRRGSSRVTGFIPTGWYPSAVAVSPDGKKIVIGSGKGVGTHPNPATTPINTVVPSGFEYIGRQLNGLLSFVDRPTAAQLAEYTVQARADTPYRDAELTRADRLPSGLDESRPHNRAAPLRTAIPTRIGDPSPIKYVLYIIKENRTYDQVFGDLSKGNGDPNLCLFGRDVSPNHHALAEQFVLLDNLYCSGEVSQDGHPWSTSAIATDFTERAWVLGYSGKGQPPGSDSVEDPHAGYLWEAAGRKGLSYRSYGEYSSHKSLAGHESLAYVGKLGPNQPAPGRDTDAADVFIREFREFEQAHSIPQFMVMSLGEDHTRGTAPGAFTPKACVASNDQALGKIVETISHSSVWKEFAIFVIEDDAQNGPDHIDAHRTVGFVISPYTRRGTVDSTMYSTVSMVRTIELILGLGPLTQYDAAATPMFASFTNKADLTPYTLLAPRIDLNAKNGSAAYGARQSARMDWSGYDRVDEDALNRILWHSIKGRGVPMPAPRHVVMPVAAAHDGDD